MRFRKLITDAERFWLNVDRTTTPDECWLWTGSVANNGYGQIGIGSRAEGTFRMARTHRFALELALGRPLGPGMCACHTCDVKTCVRPDHLWEGTQQQNTADRHAKGRTAAGSQNGAALHPETIERGTQRYNAAFTDDQVRDIRRRAAAGESHKGLAAEYGVGTSTMHHVIHRESWKHVV